MIATVLNRTSDAVRWVAGGLSTLLYPSVCCVCSAELAAYEGPYFCGDCGAEIASGGMSCDAVEYSIAPAYLPPYVPAYACFPYERAAEAAVKLLKYGGKTKLAATMGDAVAVLMSLLNGERVFDAAVAVPLHPRRKRERGFDQSRVIACRAAVKADVPLAYDGVLKRVRDTVPQVALDGEARLYNIADAFAGDRRFFAGRRIVLIDDVITTGATIRACTQAVESAGGVVGAAVAFTAPGVGRSHKNDTGIGG
jgi:predicted amidophosphoribosyltransferase